MVAEYVTERPERRMHQERVARRNAERREIPREGGPADETRHGVMLKLSRKTLSGS